MEGHGEAVEALLDAGADAAVQVTRLFPPFLQKTRWSFPCKVMVAALCFLLRVLIAMCQDNDGSDAPEWARDLEHDHLVAMFEAKAGPGSAEPEPEAEPETEA